VVLLPLDQLDLVFLKLPDFFFCFHDLSLQPNVKANQTAPMKLQKNHRAFSRSG
jgi:hypothetical protein